MTVKVAIRFPPKNLVLQSYLDEAVKYIGVKGVFIVEHWMSIMDYVKPARISPIIVKL